MTVFAVDGSPIGSGFSPEIDGLTAGEERDLVITLSSMRFAPGSYFCGVSIGRGNHRTALVDYDSVADTLFFEVGPEETSSGAMAAWPHGWGSILFPDLTIEPILN